MNKLEIIKECQRILVKNRMSLISVKKIGDFMKEELGCGKLTEWGGQKYWCGDIEDLKHQDHIILCSECQENRSGGKDDR